MTENPSHELATPEEWSRARHRETILRSLVTQSSLSETDIRLASKRMGVGRAYFYRLLAAYRLRPQTSTLLPRAGGRPSGLHLLPARTESLIHKMHRRVLHVPRAPVIRCTDTEDHSRMPTSRSAYSKLSYDQTETCHVRSDGAFESPFRGEGSR
jgi:hypothetical protein